MPALRTRDTQSRALDVPMDAPQPPTLAIVSPTPRNFTFPSHNLADSPFSSPATSPFEPDLRSLTNLPHTLATTSATPPPLAIHPRPESRSSSPVSPSHKRRKSSCSVDVERRPRKGDDDYIKRPENAFILFRRKCCEDRQAEEDAAKAEGAKKPRQADLSKTISQMWKGLPSEERQVWERMAKDKKKEHEKMYPNYVYRPQRSRDKDGKPKPNKKSTLRKLEESESLSFVVPVARPHGPHGRSASVPTPPPYQSIRIPNVYQFTPSCPTSPSLLPMISRRSAHPGHSEDFLTNFDYLPSNNYTPPSFPIPLEASIQSSDFLRNILSTNDAGLRHNEQSLQHLSLASQDTLLLPPHQLVSPIETGSSGPSSPCSGPYTPTTSLLPPNDFLMPSSGDPALDAQAQAEMDLQLQMQLQQEFAAFTWEGNSVWGSDPSILLEDDFDINAIPPIELGVPKYVENPSVPGTNCLDFGGQDYNSTPFEDSQNPLVGFEMMAGHGF